MTNGSATERTWRARLKRGARALVSSVGTQATLADLLGRSRQLVQLWGDDDFEKVIGWEHALDERLPAEARAAFFAEVAGPRVAVVVVPADVTPELGLASATMRASTEAAASLLDAVSDGHITREEGARITSAVDAAIGTLLAVRERAQVAVREGVVGTSRLRSVAGGAR